MKKNIKIIIMSAIIALSLCSCAGEKNSTPKSDSKQTTTIATEATTETATESATEPSNPIEEDFMSWEEPTEEVTEPLTEDDMPIVQVAKDYVTALEKLDLDTLVNLYSPDITAETPIYKSLKTICDNATISGISADDYKAIWESTEVYDDITFTFNDYATCKIDGDNASVKLKYIADCYEYQFHNQYGVVLKFPMINVNGQWYLNGDPDYSKSYAVFYGADFEEASTEMDSADFCTQAIDSLIEKCNNDIKNNDISKYNVESAELITVADAVQVYGEGECFETIGNQKYGYRPYWYKTHGYTVFFDDEGNDVYGLDEVEYNADEFVALAEDEKPSSSVYVVDLFK